MPLVVPGINSSMGDKSEWVNKLMGKKISETASDETVCSLGWRGVCDTEYTDFVTAVLCEERPS